MLTRLIICFVFLTLIISCNHSSSIKKKQTQIDSTIDKSKIRKSFVNWQKQQINEKRFWASDSCYPGWFDKHDVNETLDNLIYGFPSDSSINFSFADLNKDGNLDGLVTFNADQCDGGNASMWNQWQVFILLEKGNYKITDTIQVNKFASTEFDSLGFYWLDSINTNKIFGTYIEFKDEDGRCCPSIKRPVAFDFSDKKLVYIGEK